MSRRLSLRTGWLALGRQLEAIETLEDAGVLSGRAELPSANLRLLIRRGSNPRKQRKGKSGEVARKGGK
mgnify:CR=1 FL=1